MIKEHPDLYEIGDQAGLSGLQARYDEQLRGTPGVRGPGGRGRTGPRRELFRSDAAPGKSLALTMDVRLQSEAERLLAGVGAGQRDRGDPAERRRDPGRRQRARQRRAEPRDVRAVRARARRSSRSAAWPCCAPGSPRTRPSRARRPPSSTASSSRTTPTTRRRGLGQIPFRAALANSCNTAFIAERDRLKGPRPLRRGRFARHGRRPRPRLPGVLRQRRARRDARPSGPPNMIGQGRILASPMTMAAVIASVQQGEVVVPRLLESVKVKAPDHEPMTRGEAGRPARDAARGGHLRQRHRAGRRTRSRGDRQDRHRGVPGRQGHRDPRLDDRGPGRPRGRGLRRGGPVRVAAPPARSWRRSSALRAEEH